MSLKKCRYEIDEIDRKILDLLNHRAELAEKIGQEKKKSGMPVVNTKREHDILARLVAMNKGPLTDRDIIVMFKQIISICRKIQQD